MTVSEPASYRPGPAQHRQTETATATTSSSSPPPPYTSPSSSSPTTNTTKLNATTSPLPSNSSSNNNTSNNTTNTTTTVPSSVSASAAAAAATTSSLPSPEHITTARTALVASLSNLVDKELQSRASVLHSNAAAIDRQESDLVRATAALRKSNDKLAREATLAVRRVKETGNVQNWAEVLERSFLVLETTVRLANEGGGGADEDGDGDGDESGSSCSCSDCGRGSSRSGTPGASESRSRERDLQGPDQMMMETESTGKEEGQPVEGTGSLAGENAISPMDWSATSTTLAEGESSRRTEGSETGPSATAS